MEYQVVGQQTEVMTAYTEANWQGDLLQDYVRGKKDGGMFCALNQSDGNEPAIELATFLGEWECSNMSDERKWDRKGRRAAVRNICCQAVPVNQTRK